MKIRGKLYRQCVAIIGWRSNNVSCRAMTQSSLRLQWLVHQPTDSQQPHHREQTITTLTSQQILIMDFSSSNRSSSSWRLQLRVGMKQVACSTTRGACPITTCTPSITRASYSRSSNSPRGETSISLLRLLTHCCQASFNQQLLKKMIVNQACLYKINSR